MLTTDRAVLIRYERDGEGRRGSGMRVGGRYVVTADHCADGTAHIIIVGGVEYAATVHVRSGDPDIDIAVLDVPDLPEVEHLGCALVDRSASSTLSDCQALGFPVWKDTIDRPLLAQAGGYVPTAEGADPQASTGVVPLMTLKITDPEARGRPIPVGNLERPGSQWAGMSGAVVVTATKLIIGVIRSHNVTEGGRSLTVTPLDRIRNLPPEKSNLMWAALRVSDPQVLPWVPLTTEIPPTVTISDSQIVVGDMPREPVAFVALDAVDRLAEAAERDGVAVVCAVTGIRGVGKTQVAGAYARARARDGWGLVGWINAGSEDTLLTGLSRVADYAGVADPGGDSFKSALRLRDHLNTRTDRSLVVFDNAVDPDVLRPFLPAIGSAQILITSADRAFGEFGTTVDVTGFSRAESIDYLGTRTELDDDSGASTVAEELGDLPLALAQAAATIRRQHLSYQKYLDRLRQLPMERLLGRLPGDDYPRSTAAALLMSVQATESIDSTRLTNRLLRVLATLSPDGIRRELLNSSLLTDDPDTDDADLDATLERCIAGSLLTWSVSGDAVIMHRLLARVLRDQDQADGGWVTTVGETLDLIEPQLFDSDLAWSRREDGVHLITQIKALWEHAGLATDDPDVDARLQSARGWAVAQLIGAADPARAVELGREVLSDFERGLGVDHPNTIRARSNLARAYREAGRLDQAIPLNEQLLVAYERALGADDASTLACRNNLAEVYLAAGRLDDAMPLFERNLADYERVLGADHPDTLGSRNSLAQAYQVAGRLDDAMPLFERNLADYERVLGADHPDTFRSRNSLAGAYAIAVRLGEAIPMYEHSQADRERLVGADHPDALASRSNLAGIYGDAGRLDKAIELYERNLADCERLFGTDHPNILASRSNLAQAYHGAGRLDDAIRLHERNLADRERLLGTDHPDTLASRNNLAQAYHGARRLNDAIPLYERNLAVSERVLSADHPNTLKARNNLAFAYEETGRLDDAIPLFERNLADYERAISADHPDTLYSRDNVAHAYRAAGRLDDAILLYEQNAVESERLLGADNPRTLGARNSLAEAYRSAERLDDAIRLHERNLANCERVLGADHADTLTSRRNLGHAYRAAGRLDEAIQMYEQSLADRQRILGPDHPDTLALRIDLVGAYLAAGRLGDAAD